MQSILTTTIRRQKMSGILTTEQFRRYNEEGFLLVSRLIRAWERIRTSQGLALDIPAAWMRLRSPYVLSFEL